MRERDQNVFLATVFGTHLKTRNSISSDSCDQIARFLAQYLAIFNDEKILLICSIEVALNSLQWKVNFFPVINKALKITKDFNFLLECQNFATYLVTLLLSPTFDVNK